jgi:hypothetical protein
MESSWFGGTRKTPNDRSASSRHKSKLACQFECLLHLRVFACQELFRWMFDSDARRYSGSFNQSSLPGEIRGHRQPDNIPNPSLKALPLRSRPGVFVPILVARLFSYGTWKFAPLSLSEIRLAICPITSGRTPRSTALASGRSPTNIRRIPRSLRSCSMFCLIRSKFLLSSKGRF